MNPIDPRCLPANRRTAPTRTFQSAAAELAVLASWVRNVRQDDTTLSQDAALEHAANLLASAAFLLLAVDAEAIR